MSWETAIAATDTVYALVAKISRRELVSRIYEIKKRDRSKALILFAKSLKDFATYICDGVDVFEELNGQCTLNEKALEKISPENLAIYQKLIELNNAYWPGALTIIVPRSRNLPNYINPDIEGVGLRIPKSVSVAKLLAETTEKVLLSTSVNISGEKPICDYDTACQKFVDEVDWVLRPDARDHCTGHASTVISIMKNSVEVLRQGELIVI